MEKKPSTDDMKKMVKTSFFGKDNSKVNALFHNGGLIITEDISGTASMTTKVNAQNKSTTIPSDTKVDGTVKINITHGDDDLARKYELIQMSANFGADVEIKVNTTIAVKETFSVEAVILLRAARDEDDEFNVDADGKRKAIAKSKVTVTKTIATANFSQTVETTHRTKAHIIAHEGDGQKFMTIGGRAKSSSKISVTIGEKTTKLKTEARGNFEIVISKDDDAMVAALEATTPAATVPPPTTVAEVAE